MILSVPLPQAYRLLNHGPVTLVGSAHGTTTNVMAAAWVMPLDFDPPKVALVIDKNTLTRALVDASGEFSLSIPGRALAGQTLRVGSFSGRERSKLAGENALETLPAEFISAPMIAGCSAWLECRVIPDHHQQQRHDLFVAEVVAARADDQAFADGRWTFLDEAFRTLHYVAGGHFFLTGEDLDMSRNG